MIDLGLTKIALIGAVALVVIGPEKLPSVARMAGTLFGRAQRYINNVKAEAVAEATHAYEGSESLRVPADWELAAKRRDFRKKKLQQSSRVPLWFKNQSGKKVRVMSGAARVARFRPSSGKTVKFFQ